MLELDENCKVTILLKFQLLGEFEVLGGTGHPVEVSAKKGRALLAILALSPAGSTPRQRLANLLWGDRGEEQARGSLRQTLASLRRDFAAIDANLLSADDEKISLNRGRIEIDVVDFQRLAASDDVGDLRRTMALYRGELLADTEISQMEFEDWTTSERTRLHTIAVTCAEKLLPLETGRDRVELAKRLVVLEPLRESAHRALMQAYADAGENGLALQHYQAWCKLLKAELGIAPGAEIEILHKKILAHGSSSSTALTAGGAPTQGLQPVLEESAITRSFPALPDKPSIAVLPFVNMSNDSGQDYFADGIVEDIITALSRVNWLFVIARNSSFTYKGRDVDVKQIGRELGVRYILQGSVRKADRQVRISGQLVDTSTGGNLWADKFDGDMENIFDLQDLVTARVAGTIAPKLEQAEIERAKRKPAANLDAYDCYLRGMAAVHRWNREANAEALSNLYRAIELDPGFAPAYGLAARCYAQRRSNCWVSDRLSDIAESTRLARRAIDLGKDDAVALCNAGFALADVADEVEDGDAYIDRALALNPNLALAWHFSGWVKVSLGKPEIAIERLLHALRLSPQDSHIMTMYAAMACAHFGAGRYAEAFSWAEMAVREKPTVVVTTGVAAASAALAGRHADAQKMMQLLQQAGPELRLSNLKDVVSYLRPKDFDRWSEGLRMAGLPE